MAGDQLSVVTSTAIPQLVELKKNIDANLESIKAFNAEGRKIEIKLKNSSGASFSEVNAAMNESVRITNELGNASATLASNQKKLADASLQLARARTEESKQTLNQAKSDEILAKQRERLEKQTQKAIKDTERARNAESKALKQTTSDYDILNKAYADQIQRVRALFFTVGELNPVYKAAQQEAMRMGDTLKRVDAAVGIHNRNVGNYNSALGNLNQIWRELPNAGISLRTFILSLSNNLTYLAEDFAKLAAQNRALAATGQPTVSYLSLIKQSLFGVTGIASLAVAAFTAISLSMSKNEDEAKGLTTALEGLTEAIQSYLDKTRKLRTEINDSLGIGADDIKRQIAEERALGEERLARMKTQGATAIDLAREQQKQAQSLYDLEKKLSKDRVAQIDDEIEGINDRAAATKAATQAYLENYKSQTGVGLVGRAKRIAGQLDQFVSGNQGGEAATRDNSLEAAKKYIDLYYPTLDQEKKNQALEDFIGFGAEQQLALNQQLNKLTAERKNLESSLSVTELQASKQRLEALAEEQRLLRLIEEMRRKLLAMAREQNTPNIKNVDEDVAAFTKEINSAKDERDFFARLNEKYLTEEGKKALAKSQEEIFHIERLGNDALRQLGEDYQNGKIKSQERYEIEREKIVRKYAIKRLKAEMAGLEAALPNLRGDQFADALRRQAEIQKSITDLEVENFEDANKRKIKSFADFLDQYKAIAAELGNFAAQIGKNITENDLGELQKRQRALDEDVAKKKTLAENGANSEIEARRRVAEIEFQAVVDRNKLREEEIKIKQRQAIFDRANALFQIALNTAVAASSSLIKPWLIPAIIALGAAQAATVLAAPLPQYAEGTDDHPGGKFIAVEAGEREILETPDGKRHMLSEFGVYEAPKHSRVIPEHDWHKMMPVLTPQLIGNMQQMKTTKMEGLLKQVVKNTGKSAPKSRTPILLPSQRRG